MLFYRCHVRVPRHLLFNLRKLATCWKRSCSTLSKVYHRRTGFFICDIVSFLINPWYLLGSASIFVSFLASYQIFLSAITGVLLCNYYIVTRGHIDIPAAYSRILLL